MNKTKGTLFHEREQSPGSVDIGGIPGASLGCPRGIQVDWGISNSFLLHFSKTISILLLRPFSTTLAMERDWASQLALKKINTN